MGRRRRRESSGVYCEKEEKRTEKLPTTSGKSRSFRKQPLGVDATSSFYARLEEEEEGDEETTFHLQKATASGHHHPAVPRKGVGAFIRGTGRD